MHNVVIVDDQKSSRDLLKYMISESDNFRMIKSIDNSDNCLEVCYSHNVDLILMDIYTAGKENGIKNATLIKKNYPKIKIIIVTFLIQKEHINNALSVGCEGFWYKEYSDVKLVDVMSGVMNGEIIYPNMIPSIYIGYAKTSDFTKQEVKILKLIVNGYSYKEICKELKITRSTLNFHICNVKSKTGYDSTLKIAIDVTRKKYIIAEDFNLLDKNI